MEVIASSLEKLDEDQQKAVASLLDYLYKKTRIVCMMQNDWHKYC